MHKLRVKESANMDKRKKIHTKTFYFLCIEFDSDLSTHHPNTVKNLSVQSPNTLSEPFFFHNLFIKFKIYKNFF